MIFSYREVQSMANRSKTLVEQCLALNIKQCKCLKNGIYELKSATFSIKFTKKEDVLYLPNHQTVHFVKQKVGYGERMMLRCPVCYEARRKLFTKPYALYFACQKCHGLVYRTSRLSGNELDYIDYQILKIQRQFDMTHYYDYGGFGCAIEFLPLRRPKYMRRTKYEMLIAELKRLINRRIDVWIGSVKL